MTDGLEKAWRYRWAGLNSLLWGKIRDVQTWVETGSADGTAEKPAPTLTPEVARYAKAIELAGRFVMPDEVEGILAKHGQATTATATTTG